MFSSLCARVWPCRSMRSVRAASASESFRTSISRRRKRTVWVCCTPRPVNIPPYLKIENPVQKYSADIDSYYDFTHLFTALAQTLGEGYAIHKQDIFVRKQFASEPEHDGQEFLSASYFRYFNGTSLHGQPLLPDHHTGGQEEPSVLVTIARNGVTSS